MFFPPKMDFFSLIVHHFFLKDTFAKDKITLKLNLKQQVLMD